MEIRVLIAFFYAILAFPWLAAAITREPIFLIPAIGALLYGAVMWPRAKHDWMKYS